MFFSNRIKLLSDENIPIKITELLRKRGFDIKKVPIRFNDKKISEMAKLESRIILTFDKHFINKRLFSPKEYYGIVFIDIHPPLIDIILSSLLNMFKNVKSQEFKGKLFILSTFGFRIKK